MADSIEAALVAYDEKIHELSLFMEGVGKWFLTHPRLHCPDFPIVHSVKIRLKSRDHLKKKLERKWQDACPIGPENIFEMITDLAGVRVLHIYQDQFPKIHGEILNKVDGLKDWYLPEPPRAYTWDPESKKFFEAAGIQVQLSLLQNSTEIHRFATLHATWQAYTHPLWAHNNSPIGSKTAFTGICTFKCMRQD